MAALEFCSDRSVVNLKIELKNKKKDHPSTSYKPAVADRALAISDPSKDVAVDLLPDHLVLVPQQNQFWRLTIQHEGARLLDTRY